MTKYLRNFHAIILVVNIASNKNINSAFLDVTFICFGERTPFEVSRFVIKCFFYKYTSITSEVSRQPLRLELLQDFKHWHSANS